ncbi:MAG: pyridoxamine 5'-phosphate oxidase family protein [Kineosporiaceae bacterium]
MSPYRRTPRATPTRGKDRVGHDSAAVHAVLDEALVCHVGFVIDGVPRVLPTIHARIGDRVYLHGSTGTPLIRLATPDGVAVCLTVTLLDGLVLARSQFESSMNYRSVVAHGVARLVADPGERARALRAIVDHVAPGRSATSRPGTARELAATAVLALDLDEVSVKSRAGDPEDDPADLEGPHWAGVVPVEIRFGVPVPAADLRPGLGLPQHLTDYRRPGGTVSAPTR